MPRDYLPREEAKLVTWTNDFRANILAAPESYGLVAVQATQYQATRTTFVNAYNTAQNPLTRTRPNIAAKNVAKRALITMTRMLVDQIQGWPQMTNEKRLQLGITERGKKPTPSPVPGQAYVKVESVNGRQVTISIQQSQNNKGKPKGVEGANIMVAYGELPATTTDWSFAQTTGKSKTTITLDAVQEATTAWVTAFWFNGRKATGPAANPVSVNLGAAPVLPVSMKIRKAA